MICYAYDRGVNFIDTAELYRNYPAIAIALRAHPDLAVCTKSYAYDQATAEASYRKAAEELGRDYIDVFMLHEQESRHTLRGHAKALEYFYRLRDRGLIGAVGVSTHHVACMQAAAKIPELDILFPIINRSGLGIADGTRQEMKAAIAAAHAQGKTIMAMKPLAGGHMSNTPQEAFSYFDDREDIDCLAIGMQSKDEIDFNTDYFLRGTVNTGAQERVGRSPRRLMVHDWCVGCGKCVTRCPQGALSVHQGMCKVNQEKCVLCGYCASVCREFCLKII